MCTRVDNARQFATWGSARRHAYNGVKAVGAALLFLLFDSDAIARDRTFHWKCSTRYEVQRFEKDRANWHMLTGGVERKFAVGSLLAEGFRVTRFSKWDEGAAVDGYLDLWRKAYGNLRVQGVVHPDVLTTTDVYLELFQGFGKGWETSFSYRNMNYRSGQVNIGGASVGRYVGNGYYRARATANPSHGAIGFLGAASARYFFDSADDFVEVGGGVGRQVIVLGAGPTLDLRLNGYLLARGQVYFSRHVGGGLLVSFNAAQRTPWGAGASAAILGRW